MKRLFIFFFSCLILLSAIIVPTASAADVRSGDTVAIPENTPNLRDLYLFGGSIRIDSPIDNDVVAAGGNIVLNQPISGSAIVAGGDITIKSNVGNTIRAAGGNIMIDGSVTRDLVVSGGSITVSKDASVGGDVLFSGGELVLDAPVNGNVQIAGGDVTINSAINGNVNAEVGKLMLGPNARINGTLNYTSEEKAQMDQSAVVSGPTNYKQPEQDEKAAKDTNAFLTGTALYKLIADILVSLLLIHLFSRGFTAVLKRMTLSPLKSGAIGFGFIFFFPIAAFIGLILIWLGVAGFLGYGIIFLLSLFVVKLFLGWFIMRWWEQRNKKQYVLDWKAGILGPVVLFIIAAIPFIGWLACAILMFVATGALLTEIVMHAKQHQSAPQKAAAKK